MTTFAPIVSSTSPHFHQNRGEVFWLGNRLCQIWGSFRCQRNPAKPAWGWINRVNVTFLDDGSSTTMTAAQANKQAKRLVVKP